jgi:hypothetical protein
MLLEKEHSSKARILKAHENNNTSLPSRKYRPALIPPTFSEDRECA